MKKFLSLALALVLGLGLLSTAARAADSDFVMEDGVLTEYNGSGGDVAIPDGVTGIGEGAFEDCASLTGVTIPDSVTTIGNFAFDDCFSLTGVTIPDSVTEIGTYAFCDCSSLTAVTIPGSVTWIGALAFGGCESLTDVTISNGVTYIGEEAFSSTGLTSVTIPDSVTEIDAFAFLCCDSLTSMIIPASTTTIGVGAFEGCSNLTIYGIAGSYAQTYAEENGIPFVAMNAAPTAYQSTQSVLVDGEAVEFQCYALKDANGNLTNYIKLRDLADILNGSSAQFQVGWDGDVTITTKTAYTANGSEGNTPFSGDRAYQENTAATKVNGQAAELDAFVLSDDAGGGYTYYQLRDLGKAIGFNVGWSADKGIFVETDKPYDPAN